MALTKHNRYSKWEILLVDLNPVRGSEISKIRPCLVVSPGPMNNFLHTVIVVPFTSNQKGYPFRLRSTHNGVHGELCFDHIKSIDKSRIQKRDGKLADAYRADVNELLAEIFGEP